MVQELLIKCHSLGEKEELQCSISLSSRDNSNSITFECPKFVFVFYLNDVVELDDFYTFLNNQDNKLSVKCALNMNSKKYEGNRKFVHKKGSICVSQGAIRLEFGEEASSHLREIIKSIKARTR